MAASSPTSNDSHDLEFSLGVGEWSGLVSGRGYGGEHSGKPRTARVCWNCQKSESDWKRTVVTENETQIAVCRWGQVFAGRVALATLLPGGTALLLAAASATDLGLALELLATPTIPPMVRQPFSNALPSFVVLDLDAAMAGGAAGYLAAGYWDDDGMPSKEASWFSRCRKPKPTCVAV